MERQANSECIRKAREERYWSQEELSTASGLSLRTIQRLESGDHVSLETLKAIAATLEVPIEKITIGRGNFEGYSHIQRADYILLVIFITAIFVLSIPSDVATTISGNTWLIKVALLLPLIILGIVFYSLTIEVDNEKIKWHFGPNLFCRELSLGEIESSKPVHNPLWWGFGIRDFGYGRMYNVSGLLGVELTLKSGARIRLGTDEPNFLNSAIQSAQDLNPQ